MFPLYRTVCRFSVGQRTRLGLTRSSNDGEVNVISLNVETGSRSIMQLKDVAAKRIRWKYSGVLPQKAVVGLWNALSSCFKNPKVLQFEADRLKEKLNQRQFPASPKEVQEARHQIREVLEAEGGFPDRNSVSHKVLEAFDLEVKKKMAKLLRYSRYNWKPLDFKTREHAATYALARFAPNYAEVRFVLQEFVNNGFIPETVLDYGSGSGAAFWAAFEQWGKGVKSYQLIDSNEEMNQFCMDILRGSGENNGYPFVHPNISFRKFLAPSLDNTFDLIIVHRLLVELASEESRIELLTDLWKRANKYLILIDGSCKGGYNALMEARDYILMGGCELHREQTRQILMEAGALTEEAECILTDKQLSNYMRYNLIKNMLPPNTVLPTRLEPGYVFAPCPHDQGCPKNVEKVKDPCSFSTQWDVLRADGRKQIFNTETGSFMYVIMAKGARPGYIPENRLLTLKRGGGHVCCTVRTLGSDSEFSVYEEAVEQFKKEKCAKNMVKKKSCS